MLFVCLVRCLLSFLFFCALFSIFVSRCFESIFGNRPPSIVLFCVAGVEDGPPHSTCSQDNDPEVSTETSWDSSEPLGVSNGLFSPRDENAASTDSALCFDLFDLGAL